MTHNAVRATAAVTARDPQDDLSQRINLAIPQHGGLHKAAALGPVQLERARAVPIEMEIARRGIVLKGRIDQCGACPVCGGKDRFSINLRKQVFYCRYCDVGGDVIAMVQHIDGCTFAEAIQTLTGDELRRVIVSSITSKQIPEEYEREQHRKAAWLWSQRKPIMGSLCERYLRSRGIACALPATLGFLPPHKPQHHPAMIAAFGLCEEPEPGLIVPPRNVEAVHLTLLKLDGSGKADVEPNKIIIGSPGNLPLVLASPNDLLGLGVCEGIEDAFTVHEATGLGAWAAGSCGRMPKLADVIPSYIDCVTIFAHKDENGAGQDSAHQLAQALYQRGIEVRMEGLR
jgi:hypothetical protein